MQLETPTRDDVSNDAENNQTFDSRHDKLEQYWAYVDAVRFFKKLCEQYDVAVQDNGYVQFTDASDASPIAADGLMYYKKKEQLKSELQDDRADGTLESDQDLPAYRDQFESPEFEHTEVTAENAEQVALSPDQFEDDEALHIAEAYEPETDEKGAPVIWWDDGVTERDIAESAMQVKGIGSQKAGKVVNQLRRDGYLTDDLE